MRRREERESEAESALKRLRRSELELERDREAARREAEKLARERGFRAVFSGEPTIGGRYSALSPFGLVPAALGGVDVRSLLKRAREMVDIRWSQLVASRPQRHWPLKNRSEHVLLRIEHRAGSVVHRTKEHSRER